MTWNIDPAQTRAAFSVRHMMITNVHGQFKEISGTVDFDPDNPTATAVEIKIKNGGTFSLPEI